MQQLVKDDQYEMQFNYIFMREIEGGNKLEVSRTLKDCQDIELFEQESIQKIIDYKWDTYGREFFLLKFYCYMLFLLVYYYDLEYIADADEDGLRIKGFTFYFCKGICFFIQSLFFIYELVQMKIDGFDYFFDSWNYLELSGNIFFAWGAILDINNSQVTDFCRVIISISILFTLAKVVYLIRVFRQLNFLVTMFITVVNEIFYFMILFTTFLITFAQSFRIVEVDMSVYGRAPAMLGYSISVLRCAMGDFSIININQGFDLITDPDAETEDEKYRYSRLVMNSTVVIFIICCFYMFIIFMNFIIAVISDTYAKVIQKKEAFDY